MPRKPTPHAAGKTLSAERLRQLLRYDPKSGIFTWRENRGARRCKGQRAGVLGAAGDVLIRIDYRIHYARRLAVLYMTGEFPRGVVVLLNGVAGDNRWQNLRVVSPGQRTHFGRRERGAIGLRGVTYRSDRDTFNAYITRDGRSRYLGSFKTAEEAHAAYKTAAVALYGDLARFE